MKSISFKNLSCVLFLCSLLTYSCGKPSGGNNSSAAAIQVEPSLSFSYSKTYSVTTPTAVNITPTFTHGTPASCSITPALPAGLVLNNDCSITGTPTAQTLKTLVFTVTASNGVSSDIALLFLLVDFDGPLSDASKKQYFGATSYWQLVTNGNNLIDTYGLTISPENNRSDTCYSTIMGKALMVSRGDLSIRYNHSLTSFSIKAGVIPYSFMYATYDATTGTLIEGDNNIYKQIPNSEPLLDKGCEFIN